MMISNGMMNTQNLRIYLGNITSEISFYLPYTAGVLRAALEQDPSLKTKCVFPKFFFHTLNGVEALLEELEAPDVLGLSLYVWNQERSLKFARLVKARFPNCMVILGGPQVPNHDSEWLSLHPYVDFLVHQEGESAFRELIAELADKNTDFQKIRGISYRDSIGNIHRTAAREMTESLSDSPSPYLLGYMDDCIQEAQRFNRPIATVIETCRGCPYSCTFCDWGNNAFNKLRQFPMSKVEQEISYLANKVDEIYVADANFGIFPRDLDIANLLVEAKRKHGRLTTAQVIMAKQKSARTTEIAKILSQNSLSLLGETIGIQSTTPKVLETVKRKNIALSNFETLVSEYRGQQIPFYIELIVGLPGETQESFLNSLETVLQADAHDIRVYNLALLPNSELAQKNQRELHGLQTKLTKIVEGPEGESEFSENVTATKDLSREECKFLRELSVMIDVLHGGRWTYFLAWYLNKEQGVPLTKFYLDLHAHFSNPTNAGSTAIGKMVSGWYMHKLNGGYFNKFSGQHSPYDIDWSGKFFFKQTYFWLCLSENRDLLMKELDTYLIEKYPAIEQNLRSDLLRFQFGIMLRPEDGLKDQRYLELDHNWPHYFGLHDSATAGIKKSEPFQKTKTVMTFHHETVGRHLTPIQGEARQWFFEAAGGAYFDKINRFISNRFTTQTQ